MQDEKRLEFNHSQFSVAMGNLAHGIVILMIPVLVYLALLITQLSGDQ